MENKDLVVIEKVELVPFFTKGDKLDETLKAIEINALSFVAGDLSVKKNRDAVTAMVTKVTKSKTFLESKGKELAAEYKAIPRAIDENRKKTRDFLTELQEKVRQPLTDWKAEQKRLEEIEEAKKIQEEINRDHEMAELMNADFDRKRAESIAEERRLEAERQAQLEKERLECEALIAQQAKEQAEREAKEREAKLEQDRLDAIAAQEQAKRDAIAAEERAKIQSEQAEIRRQEEAKRAEEFAKQQAEAARQAEIKRQQDELDRQASELAKREADKMHIGAVRKAAKESLMLIGFEESVAKFIVMAIHDGHVANVKINY